MLRIRCTPVPVLGGEEYTIFAPVMRDERGRFLAEPQYAVVAAALTPVDALHIACELTPQAGRNWKNN